MKLSAAIRLGAAKNPPCTGDYARHDAQGVLHTDCIFAALRGLGAHVWAMTNRPADPLRSLARAYPVMRRPAACPLEDECGSNGTGPRTVDAVMVHLGDCHGFSREAVAEWLELVEGDGT